MTRFSPRDMRVSIKHDPSSPTFRVVTQFKVLSVTGEGEIDLCFISSAMPFSHNQQSMREAIRVGVLQAIEHELDECLTVNETRVRNPHPEHAQ